MNFFRLRDVRVYSDVDSWVLCGSLWIKPVLLFERSGYDYESPCLISKHLPVDLCMRNVGANYFVGATAVWFMSRIRLIRSWAKTIVPFSLSFSFAISQEHVRWFSVHIKGNRRDWQNTEKAGEIKEEKERIR